MKNRFLEVFFALDEDEAHKQLGQFFEFVKPMINGIEISHEGTTRMQQLVGKLQQDLDNARKTKNKDEV